MYVLFPMRSTCYVLCRLNSNSQMYFALKLHEVSPCPYPCLEGQVLVLGGSVLVNITAKFKRANTAIFWGSSYLSISDSMVEYSVPVMMGRILEYSVPVYLVPVFTIPHLQDGGL